MRFNEISGFLANNNKFFILLCIKGMKNNDYSKILSWYKLIYGNIGQLVYLLHNEPEAIRSTMDVLRCGLFSKDIEVAVIACRIFTKLASIIIDKS
jgi:hypothetical protein